LKRKDKWRRKNETDSDEDEEAVPIGASPGPRLFRACRVRLIGSNVGCFLGMRISGEIGTGFVRHGRTSLSDGYCAIGIQSPLTGNCFQPILQTHFSEYDICCTPWVYSRFVGYPAVTRIVHRNRTEHISSANRRNHA
jgi:hypothetical protein